MARSGGRPTIAFPASGPISGGAGATVDTEERTATADTEAVDNPLAVPNEAMVGWAREYADLMAEHLEPPRQFFYFSALACLGHLFGNMVTIPSAVDISPRIYVVLLGESGMPRKSTAAKATIRHVITDPFRDRVDRDGLVCEGVATTAGLLELFKKSSDLLMFLDGLAILSQQANDSTSVLYPMLAKLFDSTSYDHPLKKNPVYLRNARLSILTACTTETYETVFQDLALTLGFPNRLLIVPGESYRRFAIPPTIPTEALSALQKRLIVLYEQVSERRKSSPVEFTITTGAQTIIDEWYLSGHELDAAAGRLDSYLHRLLLLTALSLESEVIDERAALSTVALLDWQHRVRRAYAPVTAKSDVARMEQRIRNAISAEPMKEKGKHGLRRAVKVYKHGEWAYEQAVKNLLRAKEIEISDDGLYSLAPQ